EGREAVEVPPPRALVHRWPLRHACPELLSLKGIAATKGVNGYGLSRHNSALAVPRLVVTQRVVAAVPDHPVAPHCDAPHAACLYLWCDRGHCGGGVPNPDVPPLGATASASFRRHALLDTRVGDTTGE